MCSDSSRSVYTYHNKNFWRLKKKRKSYFQEFIKASDLLLACLNSFTGMKLKACIHINLNIALKDL